MVANCLAEYPEAHADPVILALFTPFFSSPALFTPTVPEEWTPELVSQHRSVPSESGISAGLDYTDPSQVLVARTGADVPKGTTYGDFAGTPPVLLPDQDKHAASLHCTRNGFLDIRPETLTPHAQIRKTKILLAATKENEFTTPGIKRITERIDNGVIQFIPRIPHSTIQAQATAALIGVLTRTRDTRTALAVKSGIGTYEAIARDPANPYCLRDAGTINLVAAFVNYRLGTLALKLAQKRRNAAIQRMIE